MATMQAAARQKERPRTSAVSLWTVAVYIAVAVAGLVEHLVVYQRVGSNSDEALAGLMARDVLHGHFSLFLVGQNYGGAVETLPVAAVMGLTGGTSMLAERATTLVLSAIAPVLIWFVARRLVGARAALASASFMWLWPPFFVQWSVHEYLYYEPIIVLGLAAVLLAYRTTEGHHRVGLTMSSLLCGVCIGLGWWINPEFLVFGPPLLLILVTPGEQRRRRLGLAALGAVVAAGPWLVFNLRHHFTSLDTGGLASGASYPDRVDNFIHTGAAVLFGPLNSIGQFTWADDRVVAGIVYVLTALVVVVVVAAWARRRGEGESWWRAVPIDIAGIITYPFIYALSAAVGGPLHLNPRYLFFGWPFAALLVGRLVSTRLLPRVLPVVVSGVLAIVGIQQAFTLRVHALQTGSVTTEKISFRDLASTLEAEHVTRLFGSYWQSYLLDEVAGDKVIASPSSMTEDRIASFNREVRQSPRPAWLFYDKTEKLQVFQQWLDQHGIADQVQHIEGFVLVRPGQRVLPETVPPLVLQNPAEGG